MIKNSARTVFLMTLVAVLFMMVGRLIGGATGMGAQFGMGLFFVIAMAMNFFSYWYSDKLVLRMYKAVEVDQSKFPELYRMTEELAANASVPMPKLYILPQMQPNAFATGRNPDNSAVAVTQGIMKMLTKDELRGVIAHEIAHIKNRDILLQTIVIAFVSAITMISHIAIFLPMGRGGNGGPNPVVLILTIILAPLAAAFLQSAISRTREFEADRVGAEICEKPDSLASALRKIENAVNQIPMEASDTVARSTAHMFPVNPFRGSGISRMFSTHPDTGLRIDKLMNMAKTGIYS